MNEIINSSSVYCICHAYVQGDNFFLARGNALVDAREAALYIQFTAETFLLDAWLSNHEIANLMIEYYGFTSTDSVESAEVIDMYADREFATTTEIYAPLMSKPELQREELTERIKLLLHRSSSQNPISLIDMPEDDDVSLVDEADVEDSVNDLFQREDAYCITYFYGDGGAPVYIKRVTGNVDAKRAAIYCQFKCEEWFGHERMLTNLGVASLLITFYGFQYHHGGPYDDIDMYHDHSAFCGEKYNELMLDAALQREKLREYMEPHVII